ncbi:hypothetical protein OUZ56_001123 [Daphnia magna]|uniref:Uncharacterized protein n=1 Tax=Daphnia magna TaxID=35525 RepID=A0ABR0A1P8_9CRUS|nr:hypothetical protein OUZ56_001123 [Daphnia magna]
MKVLCLCLALTAVGFSIKSVHLPGKKEEKSTTSHWRKKNIRTDAMTHYKDIAGTLLLPPYRILIRRHNADNDHRLIRDSKSTF